MSTTWPTWILRDARQAVADEITVDGKPLVMAYRGDLVAPGKADSTVEVYRLV